MKMLRYLWASPNTLVGLVWVLLAWLTGGRSAIHTGVVEAYGGAASWALKHLTLLQGGAAAITIGHVVLGRSQAALDVTRTHERVHVRQYERWGPLFIPAYLAASVWQRLNGKDPYRDNPFEVEAYRVNESERDA
jgi:hypothetical protein